MLSREMYLGYSQKEAMKKNEVKKSGAKSHKKGAMPLSSFQDVPQEIAKQEKITIELEAGNVPNPHNTISDAKTELSNLSQAGQEYVKSTIKGTKAIGIGLGILRVMLDLENGRVSKKGKEQIIAIAQVCKNLSAGLDTSEYFLVNQTLSKQVKTVQEQQGKNKDNPLKRKEMFKLLEVGKNMSKSVKAVQIDTAREVSQEAKEKKRIAEENKAKNEADATYLAHVIWFNNLPIDEFDKLVLGRKKFQKSLTKK